MKISVIIPIKNGAATLERCLQSLRNQTIGEGLEIIILDSNSKDDSKSIALNYGAKLIDIPEGSFDHGLTRNIGVEHATGDLIFLTVQDAWIPEVDMLEKMASHFEDEEVMAVVGHQAIPHEPDKNPLLWFQRYTIPKVAVKKVDDVNEFEKLPQLEQQELVAWDNVVAMYRKKALVEQPFVQTGFAEDWVWSYQALMKGWKLLRDPSLIVYHYHHQTYSYAFRATYTINYHFYKFFKYIPQVPRLINPISKAIYHLLKNKKLTISKKFYWIGHNFLQQLANYISTVNFLLRLKIAGAKGIEKGFQKYCKTIPQGKQKNS